jgi:hypothetical protein
VGEAERAVYGPKELVDLAARISAPLEGAETHKERLELLSRLASRLQELARARARAEVAPNWPPREPDTLEVLQEVYAGTYRAPPSQPDLPFSLWVLENEHMELVAALATLHDLRRRLEELCLEVYQDLEQSYMSIASGIAGRKALGVYRENLLLFAKHVRDVGLLARMPHVPGRPSPRELAALELRTGVLGDMITLSVGVPFTRKGVQRAHSLMLDAADPDRAYWLLGSSPRSEELRFKFYSSFAITVGPPSVVAIMRRSGEVYPAEKGTWVAPPPAPAPAEE